jgi:hypothetical protein
VVQDRLWNVVLQFNVQAILIFSLRNHV